MSDQNSPIKPDSAENPSLSKPVSRRTLLKIGGTIATAAVAAPILAACGDSPTATSSPVSTTAASGATTAAATSAAATTASAGTTAAASTTAAAGAATTAVVSSGGGTLQVYWGPGHNYKAYQAVIAQFEKDHPGWKVGWELYQAADMRTKLLANFNAGNPPDLVEDSGWVQEFGLQGRILSLKNFIDRDGASFGYPTDWQPYTVNRMLINGEIYGVQLHLTNILLFYNKDMLSKAGFSNPPTTWDEFLDVAKATTKNGVYGFALNQDSSYAWPWFLQNGAHWYDADKKVLVMDSPEAIEAMQFQADLIYKHKVAPVPVAAVSYEGPQKLFSAKRAAMILTGPWDLLAITSGSPDVPLGIAQALTKKVQATSAAGTSMFIPKQAKNPELAWDFMKRITALDVELAATKEANMTMPRISWGKDQTVTTNPIIGGFAKGLNYAKDVVYEQGLTGKQTSIGPLYDKMYQDVIYKNTPAEEALKTFVTAANKLIAG